MKTFSRFLMMMVLLVCGGAGLTSCSLLFGDLDMPIESGAAVEQLTPEQLAETKQLLKEAQQEGSVFSIYFTYEGIDYVAHFKRVGENYVLLKPSEIEGAGSRATRTILTVRSGDGKATVFVENTMRKVVVNGVTPPDGASLTPTMPGSMPKISPKTPEERRQLGATLAARGETEMQATIDPGIGAVDVYCKSQGTSFNGVAVNGKSADLLVQDNPLGPLTVFVAIDMPKSLKINVGDKVTITPQVTSVDGEHGAFTWNISPNPGTAADFITIDEAGNVTANHAGTGIVRVSCLSGNDVLVASSCIVTVEDVWEPVASKLDAYQAGGDPLGVAAITASTRTVLSEGTNDNHQPILNAQWNAGDELALVYQVDNKTVVTKATLTPKDDKTAAITATLDEDVTGGTAVEFIYPYDVVDGEDPNVNSYGQVRADALNNQTGKLEDIAANLELRKGVGTINVTNGLIKLPQNTAMTSKVAIWKLSLTDIGSTPASAINAMWLNIKVGDDDVATVQLESSMSELYVALPAFSKKNIVIEVLDDNDLYYAFDTTDITLSAGNYYQSAVGLMQRGR